MKGIVFTEFVDFVEQRFGLEAADTMIESSNTESGGVYTAVGTYNYQELVALVMELNKQTDIAVPQLIKAFGEHLFGSFVTGYPMFFADVSCTFEFLQNIESYIHVEVKKLYPQAELPTFSYTREAENKLTMHYQSSRPFGDLAEGLIEATIAHFGENIRLERINLEVERGASVRFKLERQD